MDIRILAACLCLTFVSVQGSLTVSQPDKTTFTTGESVTLVCNVPTHDEPNWYHSGVQVQDGGKNKIEHVHEGQAMKCKLTISNLETSDSGQYKCANIPGLDDSNTVTITVDEGAAGAAGDSGSVEITDPDDETMHVNTGESFRLSCSADRGVKLVWQVDGKPVGDTFEVNEADLDTGATSMISKDASVKEDSGVYKCVNEADAADSDEVTVHVAAEHDHPKHGEEGHEHKEGDEHEGHDHDKAHGEEGHEHHEGDENASSALIASTLAIVSATLFALL